MFWHPRAASRKFLSGRELFVGRLVCLMFVCILASYVCRPVSWFCPKVSDAVPVVSAEFSNLDRPLYLTHRGFSTVPDCGRPRISEEAPRPAHARPAAFPAEARI